MYTKPVIHFKKKFLADTCSFWGPLAPLFWISGDVFSGFQSQSGFCLIHFFAEVNVMYLRRDPPLLLPMLTSWQPAVQPVTSPHASAEVGLGSDLNGQSAGQLTNALLLCQQPGTSDTYVWKVSVRKVVTAS